MYSIYDPGLPFGVDYDFQGGSSMFSRKVSKGGLTGIELDIIDIKTPVRKAYKDLILNW